MEEFSFKEIREQYYKKEKKWLSSDDQNLMKRLTGFQIAERNGDYYIMAQDKEQECEEIIKILWLQKIVLKEKDIWKKYDLLIQILPQRQREAFPKTIALHQKYIRIFVDGRKEQMTRMRHSFAALSVMLSLMDKEIMDYSDMELVALMRDKTFSSTQKQYAVWFLKYIYEQMPERCRFNVEVSLLRKERIKEDSDFYSPKEWVSFINLFCDVDRNIDYAYENHIFAKYWLYVVLHLSLAWRKADILNIPALDILGNMEMYTQEWFDNHTFTLADAQRIINCVKLTVEQYCVRKTGARKHFNIHKIALIPTAIAFIICEQWRRKSGDIILFGRFNVLTQRITYFFHLETPFSSLKANRTLLSFFNEKTSEINALSGQAAFLTSYIRSHKTTVMGNGDTTTVYLRSTYDERETLSIGKQIIDRRAFGEVYHRLLVAAGEEKPTFRENTSLIAAMRKNIPLQKAEGISGVLEAIAVERDALFEEIYSWHENEIKEKAGKLLNGELLSKTNDVYCLMNGRCPNPVENNCILCRYSIPTTFSLMLVGGELKRLLTELGRTAEEYRMDRIRLTYQIGKLILLVKEAVKEMGYEYIETYINQEEINGLIREQSPNMIFLEELQNDTR